MEQMRQTGSRTRRKYPTGGSGGQAIKNAIIVQKGNYNTHKILLTSGTFTQDLATDDLTITSPEKIAYVGEEFDFRIEVGDPVKVVEINNRWWIVDAQQACRGYCIDDPEGQAYIYGWRFNAPPLTCCPEASGQHLLTTPDSGATYESATFQCNSDGTDRKWIFNGTKLYLSPMLDDGNVEYRTDRTVSNCTVELQQYESALFPDASSCGKRQESVCLHPLCGVYSCPYTPNGAPTQYAVKDHGVIYHKGASSFTQCEWFNYFDYPGGDALELVVASTAANTYIRLEPNIEYFLGDGIEFDPWGENIFYIDPADADPAYPATMTIYPNTFKTIESDCKPLTMAIIHENNTTGTPVICYERPYFNYFTVSGVTNNGCSECNSYNGTFVVEYQSKFSSYGSTISTSCSASNTMRWALGYYRNSPVPDESGMALTLGGDLVVYKSENADSNFTAKDCLRGPVVFTYVSDNGECSNWPATITVYPAI